MPATRTEARDQICALIEAGAVAAGIKKQHVIYDGKKRSKPAEDDPAVPWVRVVLRHQGSAKTSLTGEGGRSRFTRTASLVVQLYTKDGDGLEEENRIAPIIQASIEGKVTSGGVQFHDVTSNEIGSDGPWFLTNILARVEYDEFVDT